MAHMKDDDKCDAEPAPALVPSPGTLAQAARSYTIQSYFYPCS